MAKNQLIIFLLGALFILGFISCNSAKDDLAGLIKIVEELEKKDISAISKEEWISLDQEFNELDTRSKEGEFSENDQEEFEKLKGRVAALKLKKNMLEWKDEIKDMTNQVEGFVDGIEN